MGECSTVGQDVVGSKAGEVIVSFDVVCKASYVKAASDGVGIDIGAWVQPRDEASRRVHRCQHAP